MEQRREPRVQMIACTHFVPPEDVEWIPDPEASEAELLIEFCGRECYQSFKNPAGKSNARYIRDLLERGHGSVLEHASATFRISHVSRAFTHEMVRHRAGTGFSQESQRYVDLSSRGFVVPYHLSGDAEGVLLFEEACRRSMEAYEALAQRLEACLPETIQGTERRKLIRQEARAVLPTATETSLCVTANFREWRHIITMRAHPAADTEIREVAVLVCNSLKKVSPAVFGDFEISVLNDGTRWAKPQYVKV